MSAFCTCPSGDGSLSWPCPIHPPANSDYPTLEDCKVKFGAASNGAILAKSRPILKDPMSVEQILKLVCEHTGRRISLNLAELDQYISFARAIERHTLAAGREGSAELGLHNVKTRMDTCFAAGARVGAGTDPAELYSMNLDNGVADYE